MKQIIASVLVALPILLNAQQACEPTADLNQDGVVGISDLLNLLNAFGDTDLDFDGIYDSVDECVGAYDECGVCNGPGSIYDCGCTPIPEGDCDCNGSQLDSLGICGGYCFSDINNDGVCDNLACDLDSILYNGYWYETVSIAGQCWFAENLRTVLYANGDSIPNWDGETTTPWFQAGNNQDVGMMAAPYILNSQGEWPCVAEILGYHYNGHAIADSRGVCPSGWHVPTVNEYEVLFEFAQESAALRSTNESDLPEAPWPPCNYGVNDIWDGTDLFGFNALRSWGTSGNTSYTFPYYTAYWTATQSLADFNGDSYHNVAIIDDLDIETHQPLSFGFSVRCLKD